MCAWLTCKRTCCCDRSHLRIDALLGRALTRQLRVLAEGKNVDADLDAGHPVVAAGARERAAVFFPVAVGAHARAEARFRRAHGFSLRRLRLPERRKVGARLHGGLQFLFQ